MISVNVADEKLTADVLDFVLLYPSCVFVVVVVIVIVIGNVSGFDNKRLSLIVVAVYDVLL